MNNLDYIRPDLSALEYWLKDNSNFELLNKLNSMTLTDNTIKSLNPYLIIMADPKSLLNLYQIFKIRVFLKSYLVIVHLRRKLFNLLIRCLMIVVKIIHLK